ncbi:MAG: glycosyltransferase [Acidobacteria bacterium]|nr:glycosyltransferase [Acidobacteriota bacterium]
MLQRTDDLRLGHKVLLSMISAIVPARNEEMNIERAVVSLAAQPEISEIIVVNDQSTDQTSQVLEKLKNSIPHLRILNVDTLPDGWVGKNYACSLGAAAASGAWLLFTDADVTHLPGSANRALEDAARTNAQLVSYSPEQEMQTWWERAVIPFIFCRLAKRFVYEEINSQRGSAAANGQYLLIARKTYDQAGGHSAIRSDVVDDVALAKSAKSSGARIFFGPGKGIARTRMYRTFGAMWSGWVKNLYPLMRGGEIKRTAYRVLFYGILLAWAAAKMDIWLALSLVGLVFLTMEHSAYWMELKQNQFPRSVIKYFVPAFVLYYLLLAASAWAYFRGTVKWKERKYATKLV